VIAQEQLNTWLREVTVGYKIIWKTIVAQQMEEKNQAKQMAKTDTMIPPEY